MRRFVFRTAHTTPDAENKTPRQKLLPLSRTLVLHLRPNTYCIVFTPCRGKRTLSKICFGVYSWLSLCMCGTTDDLFPTTLYVYVTFDHEG